MEKRGDCNVKKKVLNLFHKIFFTIVEFQVFLMLTNDLWSAVFQYVDCSKTLLQLRLVNKSFMAMLPMDTVIGIPINTAHIMWSPKVSEHGLVQLNEHEDVEGALVDNGKEFWSWAYTNPIRLTKYSTIQGKDYSESVTKQTTKFQ